MDRDTFSHIRLWCPRPFGTYSQNRPRATGAGGGGGSGGGTGGSGGPSPCKTDAAGGRGAPATEGQDDDDDEEDEDEDDACSENTPPCPEPASSSSSPPSAPPPPAVTAVAAPGEDGRVLLDTWYVIKPGNTKEKIAFFVAHQCSGAGLPRPSAMKVKGNWVTGCSKAKRRRRCSSYDPPTAARTPDTTVAVDDHPPAPSPPPPPEEVSESDLLSVAEMVALVEQRTAMALQGMVMTSSSSSADEPGGHAAAAVSGDPTTPMVFLSEGPPPPTPPPPPPPAPRPPLLLLPPSTEEQEQEEESRRVAHAVARFESQNPEEKKPPGSDSSPSSSSSSREPGASPNHGRGAGGGSGEVRIAFRVSSLDPRSQSEPAGRPRCMFMSCGGGGGAGGGGARAKEKITCDLYQLVSPSSRDPSLLLGPPKPDDSDRTACGGGGGGPDPALELRPPGVGDKKGGPSAAGGGRGERLTGFHVEVVVTGAVDQCVFYGKDSTENVQEETVCFAMPGVAGGDPSEDPPPGQLFFLQAGGEEEEDEEEGGRSGADDGMMCPLDCGNNGPAPVASDSPLGGVGGGGVGGGTAMAEDHRPDPSPLCRLYRHVSHDFLEIRFQIQRLLEPRQYMLLLPHHIALNIFAWLPTRSLAALKCTCRDFRDLIELYGVRATDSRWNRDPLYRDDPCKQCKRRYERGDVSLCRWHPKPYHHDLPYGRSYWMCCRRADKDTPGCRVGLHDNNWVQQCELPPALQPRPKREDGR